MKKLVLLSMVILLSAGWQYSFSDVLSEQQQQELLENVLYMRGEGPMPASFDSTVPPRCGTELALNFLNNRDNFTGKYAAMAEMLEDRPSLPFSYVSPAGYFRIHYATSGSDAVYLPLVDDDSDGIPDYVNKVADIADSVWEFEVNHLGFPAPPPDTGGGDTLKDIYIIGLGSQFYGMTWYEDQITLQSYTSFIEIDNDFNFWPYNESDEMESRLDAARVTIAHEFFHTIHYAMDATEYENHGGYDFLPWWEMSAVWMEEMMYDDINDYYYYLPYYYDYPWLGLQHAIYTNTVHQYSAAIFPLYLSEKFVTSLIKDIWEGCALQPGPQFLQAIDAALVDYTITSDTLNIIPDYDIHKAFSEFSVWNLFTGTRASQAPAGYRFTEAEEYPMIPDSAFLGFANYDIPRMIWPWPDTLSDGSPFLLGEDMPITFYMDNMPQSASAHYLDLQNLSLLIDTTFYFSFVGAVGIKWYVSFVGFQIGGIGQAEILGSYEAPQGSPLYFQFDPAEYGNVVVIPTPVDTAISAYPAEYGYSPILSSVTPEQFADSYEFSSPFPNPIEVSSPTDSVCFKSKIITSSLSGIRAKMEVTIFNIAGEKVNVIPENSNFSTYYNRNEITVGWKLDNASGKKVAPGVYLAYCHVIAANGGIEGSEKFKVAVIR